MIFSLARTVPAYQLLFRELLRGMHSQKTRQTAEDPGLKREWARRRGCRWRRRRWRRSGGAEKRNAWRCRRGQERKRETNEQASGDQRLWRKRDEWCDGPRGPNVDRKRTSGATREDPRLLVSARGTKTHARPKAGARKKGQQVDGVSGLSG